MSPNDATYTFEHNGITYQDFTADAALAAGVPQAVIDGIIAGLRRDAVKAECRRRIYAVASAETQMNMIAAAAMVSAKSASSRSDAEKAVLAGQEASLTWVAEMRANVATLAANPGLDIASDASWPECPQAAMALADQF